MISSSSRPPGSLSIGGGERNSEVGKKRGHVVQLRPRTNKQEFAQKFSRPSTSTVLPQPTHIALSVHHPPIRSSFIHPLLIHPSTGKPAGRFWMRSVHIRQAADAVFRRDFRSQHVTSRQLAPPLLSLHHLTDRSHANVESPTWLSTRFTPVFKWGSPHGHFRCGPNHSLSEGMESLGNRKGSSGGHCGLNLWSMRPRGSRHCLCLAYITKLIGRMQPMEVHLAKPTAWNFSGSWLG